MPLLTDPARLHALIRANARDAWKPSVDDSAAWLSNPAHFALAHGDDLAMFEAKGDWPGPLHGHVFFKSRGKAALATARAMIGQAFAYGATEILGETPAQYRDALMFIRLLGFRPYGEEDRPHGRIVLSRLSNQ